MTEMAISFDRSLYFVNRQTIRSGLKLYPQLRLCDVKVHFKIMFSLKKNKKDPEIDQREPMCIALKVCYPFYKRGYDRETSGMEYPLMERVKNAFLDVLGETSGPHTRRQVAFVPGLKISKKGVFYTRRIDLAMTHDYILFADIAEDTKFEYRHECMTFPHVAATEIRAFLDYMLPEKVFVCGLIGSYQYPLPKKQEDELAKKFGEKPMIKPVSHAFAFCIWRDDSGRHHLQIKDNRASAHNDRFHVVPGFLARWLGEDTVFHPCLGVSAEEKKKLRSMAANECVWCAYEFTARMLDWGLDIEDLNKQKGVPRNNWYGKSPCEITWDNIVVGGTRHVLPTRAPTPAVKCEIKHGPNKDYLNKVIAFGQTSGREVYAAFGFNVPLINAELPVLSPGHRGMSIDEMELYVEKERRLNDIIANNQP